MAAVYSRDKPVRVHQILVVKVMDGLGVGGLFSSLSVTLLHFLCCAPHLLHSASMQGPSRSTPSRGRTLLAFLWVVLGDCRLNTPRAMARSGRGASCARRVVEHSNCCWFTDDTQMLKQHKSPMSWLGFCSATVHRHATLGSMQVMALMWPRTQRPRWMCAQGLGGTSRSFEDNAHASTPVVKASSPPFFKPFIMT